MMMTKAKMIGFRPRFSHEELHARVRAVREAANEAPFDHPQRERILDTFAAIYREMESDTRNDGACHLLAALSHVVLAEQGIDNTLCVGTFVFLDREGREASASHSWVTVGRGIIFDVAVGRPLVEGARSDPAPILAGLELPAARPANVIHGVRLPLDLHGLRAASLSLGEFAADFKRKSHGIDFWFWAARTCRDIGIKSRIAKLEARYRNVTWTHVETDHLDPRDRREPLTA
jgi:hypothetical protein